MLVPAQHLLPVEQVCLDGQAVVVNHAPIERALACCLQRRVGDLKREQHFESCNQKQDSSCAK